MRSAGSGQGSGVTTGKLAQAAAELHSAGEVLLAGYDPEALHRLRVTVRRIRSHLAHVRGEPARKLRRELKRLVAQTNEARDWDTLCDRLARPDNARFAALLPAVGIHQSRAHAKVQAMLRTRAWAEALDAWQSLAHRQAASSPGGSPLHEVAMQFLRAREVAENSGSIDDWHKLRIAAKSLRYCLDELAAAGDVDHRVIRGIALCRQLQDDLGEWHDTVVHRDLIGALSAHELEGGATNAVSVLAQELREEGHSCLQQAVARMRQHRDLLVSLAAPA